MEEYEVADCFAYAWLRFVRTHGGPKYKVTISQQCRALLWKFPSSSVLLELFIQGREVGIGEWQIKTKTIYYPPSDDHFTESIGNFKVQIIAKENWLKLKIPHDWRNTAEMGLPELCEAVCEKKPE